MAAKIKVKPGKDLTRVPHPDAPGVFITRPRDIERTPACIRFLKTGDLVEEKPLKRTAKKAASKATEKKQ